MNPLPTDRLSAYRLRGSTFLLWALLLLPSLVLADAWGLVVGIDEYRYKRDLKGAVNDARDIEKALRAVRAKDVIVLLNGNATRANITTGWERLVRQARAGDTLVFSYAGHGAQEREHVPGSESDGRDEVLVLGGFRERRPGNGERIVDNELNQWFSRVGHLNIVFVADACHSGTLTRTLDPRADLLGTRLIDDYGPIEDDELPPPAIQSSPDGEEPPPHVTFLGAGSDNERTREVNIDGKPRGALSWSFARALEGQADVDRNGVLDRSELHHYLVETVRLRTEFRQYPRLAPRGDSARPVIPLAHITAPAPLPGDDVMLKLQILGLPPGERKRLFRRLQGVVEATQRTLPDLIWDPSEQQVLSTHGDIIARLEASGQEPVQNVIDKWRLLETVKRLSMPHILALRLEPGDALHRAGDVVSFTLSGQHYPYLTVFNLASNGTVQFLYPVKRWDRDTSAVDRPFQLLDSVVVTPPFGADHLVAIVTPGKLTALHETLRRLHEKPSASLLGQVLEKADWSRYQRGVMGLYTAP